MWAKPTTVDVQSFREGTEVHGTPPGQGWAYNDVRISLLTYALTALMGRSLADVLLSVSSMWGIPMSPLRPAAFPLDSKSGEDSSGSHGATLAPGCVAPGI